MPAGRPLSDVSVRDGRPDRKCLSAGRQAGRQNRATIGVMSLSTQANASRHLRQRFQFYAGPDELPLLEASVREHGTVQRAVIAALRAHAAALLASAEPAQVAQSVPATETPPPPDSPSAEPGATLDEALQAFETIELYTADAARVLRITTEAVRSRIERSTLKGRRDNTGHWLVELYRETVCRSGIEFDPRGAAAVLGSRASTIRQRCLRGQYPSAHNDGAGWWIPVSDLLD